MQLDVALFMENYEDQLPVKTAAGMEGYPGADVIVVVDCRKRSSLGIFLPLVDQAREVHIYDHHQPDPDDIEGSEIRVEPVGAVTTLLVEEIRRRRIPLSEMESSLMLLYLPGHQFTEQRCHTRRVLLLPPAAMEQGVEPALIRNICVFSGSGRGKPVASLIRGRNLRTCGRSILLAAIAADYIALGPGTAPAGFRRGRSGRDPVDRTRRAYTLTPARQPLTSTCRFFGPWAQGHAGWSPR